jgi:ferric-dicitrate binding protein FerR (iron transport regulator)
MKDSACERWIELSDRVAIGEELSDEERRFERDHLASCASCAAEARVWEALGSCLEDHSEPPRAVEVPAIAARERGATWRRRGIVAAVAAAAVAAAGLLVANLPSGDGLQPRDREAAGDARVSLVLVSGEVSVRGAQASAGAELRVSDVVQIRRGRACLSYSKGTSACADERSELRLVAADRDRRLMLESGSVVCRLDRQPPGVRFSVDTPQGRVTAKGTVFAVERLGDSEVAVRVHRGVVEIETTNGQRQELRAPAGAMLRAGEIRGASTTGEDWRRDARMVEAADLWAEGAVAPVDIQADPAGARIELDGVGLGESPVSILVGRGEHELAVVQEGFATHRERLVVKGAERVSRSPVLVAELEASTSAEARSGSEGSAAPVPSAAELLARARSLRSSGRYREAGSAYQRLMATHPRSALARVALVSLGELQLSQLGSPAAALQSFDAYLAGGGSLTQEARYGRIRALRQLGRSVEARRASEAFVRDYPGSAQAKSLRESAKGR